jgi:hypothetical protein
MIHSNQASVAGRNWLADFLVLANLASTAFVTLDTLILTNGARVDLVNSHVTLFTASRVLGPGLGLVLGGTGSLLPTVAEGRRSLTAG